MEGSMPIVRVLTFFLLFTSCSHVFYHPAKRTFWDPSQFHVESKEIHLTTSDGVKLHGLHLLTDKDSPQKKKGTLLFFHGNAENLTTHFVQLNWILKHGYEVIIFDYRGYGQSEGEPNQRGTYLDALTFLNYAYDYHVKQGNKKFIVHGQSLGGVVAMRALVDFKYTEKVDLFVADSTFNSYQNIAFDKLTSFWLTFLFSPLAYLMISDEMGVDEEHFKSLDKRVRFLVIHGTNDFHVPDKFGKKIFNQLKEKHHQFWTIPDGYHIDLFVRERGKYQKKYLEYLEKI